MKAALSPSFVYLLKVTLVSRITQIACYTSKTIQNEVIAVIRDYFCQCLEKCPHFSLIADERTSHGREILSVCLRFLDFVENPCRPIKRVVLIHLCDLTRTTVKAIATALTESLKKHNIDIANWMNECVFIYRTYHMVSRGGLQFYLSEIGRQLVEAPLAAAISPCLISPTHPTHAWNVQLQRSGLWHDIIHESKQKRCSSRNRQMCTRHWLSRMLPGMHWILQFVMLAK